MNGEPQSSRPLTASSLKLTARKRRGEGGGERSRGRSKLVTTAAGILYWRHVKRFVKRKPSCLTNLIGCSADHQPTTHSYGTPNESVKSRETIREKIAKGVSITYKQTKYAIKNGIRIQCRFFSIEYNPAKLFTELGSPVGREPGSRPGTKYRLLELAGERPTVETLRVMLCS